MPFDIESEYVFVLLAGIAVALVAEAIYLLFHSSSSYRDRINRRLALLNDGDKSREGVLVQLRRERGLTNEGEFNLPIEPLNRLIMQSGLSTGVTKLVLFSLIVTVAVYGAMVMLRGSLIEALITAFIIGIGLPYLALRIMRGRRLKKFGEQFPDALDIIVRSLRAGHPVPIAVSMVGREFTDPVGTEFGIVTDEITYGSDLEGAMRNLQFRVGQDDLPLFVTAVAIQGSTGGNLSEILENLSAVIRQRSKMRRKVRALASEARASALILSALPIVMFAIINFVSPDFYSGVWHFDLTQYALAAAGSWMLMGNFIMYRMVNFRF
ncbi:MAG TPA: type II secretion system F family protein [Xanthobacteraceae bacterium]|nr:type II secretion system F family protein [Xanthobacteraceae bacterium]